MSADVLQFETFELSSKGLFARILLPNNAVAVRGDIATISYSVHNRTDGGAPETGVLDVTQVMFTSLQTANWTKDKIGYTFWWAAPGTLWALPDKEYRIVIIFTIIAGHANPQLAGKSFRIAYEADTKPSSG